MNAEQSEPSSPQPGRCLGLTFIEVLFAVVILALALIPVFGLITGGLVSTDVSVTFTTGVKLAQSVMNHLLSDEVPFRSLPLTNEPPGGGVAGYPAPGAPPDPTNAGNVVMSGALDAIFPTEDWVRDDPRGARYTSQQGTRFYVQVWIGNYSQDADLQFSHYEAPVVDYTATTPPFRYYRTLVTDQSDYTAGFSPYIETTGAVQLKAGQPWGASLLTKNLRDLSEELDPVNFPDVYKDFVKIVVRVSWLRRDKKDARWNEYYLVSFRANRGG